MPVMGSMSRDASGGPQDLKQLFIGSRSLPTGGTPLQNALAQCYENAWGIDQDISKALLWYRSSAELDHAPAMWNLGRVFDNGIGVKLTKPLPSIDMARLPNAGTGSDRCLGRLLSRRAWY